MPTTTHDSDTPTTALAPVTPTDALAPMPLFSGNQMAVALTAYRELQNALDRSMPEQIMRLDDKPFRKKGYWRAIAVAFGLTVEPIEEHRTDASGSFRDGQPNFGYTVTYRATAPNGRSVTGDGSCFAIEKARRFRCPHPQPNNPSRTIHWPAETCPDYDPNFRWKELPAQSSEHNIRSHAHTRAFNRAVSNLVGFGEVSAEEVDRDDDRQPHAPVQPATPVPHTPPANVPPPATATVSHPAGNPTGHIGAVRVVKSGRNNRGPWTLMGVRLVDDAREFFTFDTGMTDVLQSFIGTPMKVELRVKAETSRRGEEMLVIQESHPFKDISE